MKVKVLLSKARAREIEKRIFINTRTCQSKKMPQTYNREKNLPLILKTICAGHHEPAEVPIPFYIIGSRAGILGLLENSKYYFAGQQSQRKALESKEIFFEKIYELEDIVDCKKFFKKAETLYNKLKEKIPSEEARMVLPQAVKSNIIENMSLREIAALKREVDLLEVPLETKKIINKVWEQTRDYLPEIIESFEEYNSKYPLILKRKIEVKEHKCFLLDGKPRSSILTMDDEKELFKNYCLMNNYEINETNLEKIVNSSREKIPEFFKVGRLSFIFKEMPFFTYNQLIRHRSFHLIRTKNKEIAKNYHFSTPKSFSTLDMSNFNLIEEFFEFMQEETRNIIEEIINSKRFEKIKNCLTSIFPQGTIIPEIYGTTTFDNYVRVSRVRTCNNAQKSIREFFNLLNKEIKSKNTYLAKLSAPTCLSLKKCFEGEYACKNQPTM